MIADILSFKQTSGDANLDTTLSPRSPYLLSTGGGLSYSIRATNGTEIGFLTAAHTTSLGGDVYNNVFPYPVIGSTRLIVNTTSTDAAFVRIDDSSFTNSSYVIHTVSPQVSLQVTTIASTTSQGATIYKCGKLNGTTNTNSNMGTVISTSLSYFDASLQLIMSDMLAADYYSESGDSGGLIYFVSSTYARPLGIHRASYTPNPPIPGYSGLLRYSTKMANAVSGLGVTLG